MQSDPSLCVLTRRQAKQTQQRRREVDLPNGTFTRRPDTPGTLINKGTRVISSYALPVKSPAVFTKLLSMIGGHDENGVLPKLSFFEPVDEPLERMINRRTDCPIPIKVIITFTRKTGNIEIRVVRVIVMSP